MATARQREVARCPVLSSTCPTFPSARRQGVRASLFPKGQTRSGKPPQASGQKVRCKRGCEPDKRATGAMGGDPDPSGAPALRACSRLGSGVCGPRWGQPCECALSLVNGGLAVETGPRVLDLNKKRRATHSVSLLAPRLQALLDLAIVPPPRSQTPGFLHSQIGGPQETDRGTCQWQDAKRQLCVRPPLSASVRSFLPSPAFRVGRPLLATRG